MTYISDEWYDWKGRIWDHLTEQFGYPGLTAFEQYILRSHNERRCAECGLIGTIKQATGQHSLVQSVPHYWLCEGCFTTLEDKHAIDTTEAAARLKVTPAHVRRLCRRGVLRSRQVGRTWLIWQSSVAHIQASH